MCLIQLSSLLGVVTYQWRSTHFCWYNSQASFSLIFLQMPGPTLSKHYRKAALHTCSFSLQNYRHHMWGPWCFCTPQHKNWELEGVPHAGRLGMILVWPSTGSCSSSPPPVLSAKLLCNERGRGMKNRYEKVNIMLLSWELTNWDQHHGWREISPEHSGRVSRVRFTEHAAREQPAERQGRPSDCCYNTDCHPRVYL